MPATVTVTGTIGAGVSITSAVIQSVLSFTFDCVTNLLTVVLVTGPITYSINAATTISATKSGNTYTLTVS